MADLTDLARITGQLSISDMTDAELLEHLRQIRANRRQTKAYDARTTERKPRQPKPQDELSRAMKMMTPAQMEELLAKLGDSE
jgi:hypothetical protein